MSDLASNGLRPRAGGKSAAAYRTISEVSDELDVPQHVLRFWETKFTQVRPLKRGGGRRYYRPEDVGLLRRIQKLLYQDGYTIRGVQRLLREGRLDRPPAPAPDPVTEAPAPPTSGTTVPRAVSPDTVAQQAVDEEASTIDETLPDDLRSELTDLLSTLRTLRASLERGRR